MEREKKKTTPNQIKMNLNRNQRKLGDLWLNVSGLGGPCHMLRGVEEDETPWKKRLLQVEKSQMELLTTPNFPPVTSAWLFGHLGGFAKPRRSQACFDLQSRSCLMGGGRGSGEKPKGTLFSVRFQHTPEDTISGALVRLPTRI